MHFLSQTPQCTSMSNLYQAKTKDFSDISINKHTNSTTAPFYKHHMNKLVNSGFHVLLDSQKSSPTPDTTAPSPKEYQPREQEVT